ncbi:DUF4476 domain-containing protein [Flavobacterium antarcticum]|uniref:DUF4476 domain-containing protein n=1 Tax=Flavobacterium antarcticum TaxID=271155 RepID=UPI0003B33045|nr:DUF4476 domain-containing protein [Flavobacterium antarcticum]
MKKFYTICLLVVCLGMYAQEAGKAGELLKNEVKDNENKTQQNTRHSNKDKNGVPTTNRNGNNNGRRNPINNNEYRWNTNYGTSEVFLRIPENDRFTVEIGDQMMSNATGKFRFFDLKAGLVPISIYDDNFLIYRTKISLRNNTRTVLDFFSDYGLYLLGNYPQNKQSYGFNEWDDVWNNPYGNQQNDFNPNYGNQGFYGSVMNNQEFNTLLKTIKREANFDDSKSQMIFSIGKHTNFTATQTRDLVKLLSFEDNRLALAKQLFSKCVDKKNFYQVYEAFNFESSKRELSTFISNY